MYYVIVPKLEFVFGKFSSATLLNSISLLVLLDSESLRHNSEYTHCRLIFRSVHSCIQKNVLPVLWRKATGKDAFGKSM